MTSKLLTCQPRVLFCLFYKNNGLKQHTFVISQVCRSEVWKELVGSLLSVSGTRNPGRPVAFSSHPQVPLPRSLQLLAECICCGCRTEVPASCAACHQDSCTLSHVASSVVRRHRRADPSHASLWGFVFFFPPLLLIEHF